MRKIIKILSFTIVSMLIITFAGCDIVEKKPSESSNPTVPVTLPTMNPTEPNTQPTKGGTDVVKDYKIEYVNYDNDLYHEFFDINSHVEFKIDISESELALIQSDYEYYSNKGAKSPIYRKADVTIIVNGKEYFYDEVGIRMKGNTSRRNFYNSHDGIYDLIHYKLAFNQTFDDTSEYENPKVWANNTLRKERKDRMFAGMDKLNLKWNKNFDETFTRESWALNMFEDFGVLAPKVTPSRVQLKYRDNYETLGIFFVNENVDKYFLEKRLDPKHLDGDLYKVGWSGYGGELTKRTIYSIGIEDPNISYKPIYDLKTNKKTSNHTSLINLINKLDTNSDVSEIVYLDYHLRFEAVSYLVGNPDDLRTNYNNYYIYFLKDSNLAIIIPYDYDRVLGITKDWDPTGNAMTSFSPFTKRVVAGNEQVNPLVLKTVARGANLEYLMIYRQYVLDGLNSKYFDLNEFYKNYEINKSKYKDEVYISITRLKHYESYFAKSSGHNTSIETYLINKKKTVNELIDAYK